MATSMMVWGEETRGLGTNRAGGCSFLLCAYCEVPLPTSAKGPAIGFAGAYRNRHSASPQWGGLIFIKDIV